MAMMRVHRPATRCTRREAARATDPDLVAAANRPNSSFLTPPFNTTRDQILAQVRQTTIKKIARLGLAPPQQRLNLVAPIAFQVQLDHGPSRQAQRFHSGAYHHSKRRRLDVGVWARARCGQRQILDRVVRRHAAATSQQVQHCRRDHALEIGRRKLRNILRGAADPPKTDADLLLSFPDVAGRKPVSRPGRTNRAGKTADNVIQQRRQLPVVGRCRGNRPVAAAVLVKFGCQTGFPVAG